MTNNEPFYSKPKAPFERKTQITLNMVVCPLQTTCPKFVIYKTNFFLLKNNSFAKIVIELLSFEIVSAFEW